MRWAGLIATPGRLSLICPPCQWPARVRGMPYRGGLGEDLRAMGQKEGGDGGCQSVEGGFQVRVSGAKIIYSRDGERSLFRLNHPVRVDQEPDLILPEDRSGALSACHTSSHDCPG